ncbi:MAG: Tex-like N-terminal domain-containing protein, partial [Rhodoferax sp.]|nr:Tex-like N-terminal domain-containing protein [Rhodoferax sp.]
MPKITAQIAQELRVHVHQVAAAVALLDGGATVPFVARYRKEATGGLDDIQLRELEARLSYLRELHERLQTVIKAIDEQGKLTPTLLAALHAAATKQELEDLYLPFKLKRCTKGQLAREAGLEPLADALLANPHLVPADEAQKYVLPFVEAAPGEDKKPDFSNVPAVLDGVRDLLSERWAETPALVQNLREWLWANGLLQSRRLDGKNESDPDVAKFRDYFDYDEPIGRVPSHRALAVFRGRSLDILEVKLVLPEAPSAPEKNMPNQALSPVNAAQAATKSKAPAVSLAEARMALQLGWSHQGRAADDFLRKCVAWTWRVKLSLSTERDLFARLREAAEGVAIKVFADNLRDLLLAAPAGPRVVL